MTTLLIKEELERIWQYGQDVDLTGVGYGRIHWDNEIDIWDFPAPYYYFLAGWCRLFRARRVLEIGTHWGGSAVSMARGMVRGSPMGEELKIVTLDLTEESDNFIPNQRESSMIHKIVGDANSSSMIRKTAEAFSGEVIDLLYIDAEHTEMSTFFNFVIYAILLKPKVVICDDIELSDGMRSFWSLAKLCAAPQVIVNVVDYVPAVRATVTGETKAFVAHRGGGAADPGFGYIRFRV
jgi:cephalosporin hydroxylase